MPPPWPRARRNPQRRVGSWRSSEGPKPWACGDGPHGLRRATTGGHDLLIVDRLLSGFDGLRIVSALRQHGGHRPVLVLSALGTAEDRVAGLRAGCDDYLVKPFAFAELLARAEALLRRALMPAAPHSVLRASDLEIDLPSRCVTRGGRAIQLSATEFQLLEFLMRHAGQVVTRDQILDAIWGPDFVAESNIVDRHIRSLRVKLQNDYRHPRFIATVPGRGYRFIPTFTNAGWGAGYDRKEPPAAPRH